MLFIRHETMLKNKLPANPSYCPGCNRTESILKCLGSIPASDTFAGRTLEQPISTGFLYRCRDCGLRFRYPQLEIEELNRLYNEGELEHWKKSSEQRTDWAISQDWLYRYCRRDVSILDIGCFAGDFLESLG